MMQTEWLTFIPIGMEFVSTRFRSPDLPLGRDGGSGTCLALRQCAELMFVETLTGGGALPLTSNRHMVEEWGLFTPNYGTKSATPPQMRPGACEY
jgi:hypothetical protein